MFNLIKKYFFYDMHNYVLYTHDTISQWDNAYYFTTYKSINDLEMTSSFPDALRLLVEDREETPYKLESISNPFVYLWKKYSRKNKKINWHTCRCDWWKGTKY